MVLKIPRPTNMTTTATGDHGGESRLDDPRSTKKPRVDDSVATPTAAAGGGAGGGGGVAAAVSGEVGVPTPPPQLPPMNRPQQQLCCAGCGVSERSVPLLLFEDPEEDHRVEDVPKKPEEEKRYCAGCMTGKKVRVFWPVDSQWYIADVQRYDANTGEHLLRYPDGDEEWVRIGEEHSTNTQYKEYFRSMRDGGNGEQGTLSRLPSLGNGVSFALSAMSQSFGMPGEDEKTMRLKHPSQQQRLFQQLNLDRTASSMSSFGLYGARQPSFGQHAGGNGGGRAPPFQILSPNYTHSFSSKIGMEEFGPPPPHPHSHHHPQQQREEGGANLNPTSPGTRDGAPPGWSSNQYPNPNYYDGGHQYPPPYPQGQQPPSNPRYNSKPQQTKARPSKSSSLSSKPPKSTIKLSGIKTKKAIPKAWSKEEDEYLLDLVLQMKHPLKWSNIAQSLSDHSAGSDAPPRTGKQCRERYVNHLNPRLKHSEFTPHEDATIWRLYATVGTQWAKMSKVVPGRTDNNLKNRFHNLKRQLQREEDGRLRTPEPEGYKNLIYTDRIRDVNPALRTRIEDMWNLRRNIGLSAALSVQDPKGVAAAILDGKDGLDSSLHGDDEYRYRKFGPFETVTEPLQCGRCGLFMPSVHCGNEMCTKTKWCRTCTKVSMHLAGNVLRECLNLRKSQKEPGVAVEVEKLRQEVWNGC